MAFKKKFEVTCDHMIGTADACNIVGVTYARNKQEANSQLVGRGWSYHDFGPSCIHHCPEHNPKDPR